MEKRNRINTKPKELRVLIIIMLALGFLFLISSFLVIPLVFPMGSIFVGGRYALAICVSCFFTAHLCVINDNSGRYCTIILSLVMSLFAIFDLVRIVTAAQNLDKNTDALPFVEMGPSIFIIILCLCMLTLIFCRSVSEHFDHHMEDSENGGRHMRS